MTLLSKTLSTTQQLISGTADPVTVVQRRMTCYQNTCDNLTDTPGIGYTCGPYKKKNDKGNCGCVIEDKIKVAGQHCPLEKWLPVIPQ